ncbi:LppU/SCO3897 family protein [Kutzneria sp. CA-103260]|uniref:LppU/SCO3897 family protein n=1 Tax=Kutzneria sp. CA-103260 TaxID=2802641 RepID=UPI001BA9E386|nr:hypothetical protein [Kutzneria sp. CA-103260]QUQ68083.1 hypothetical protein JJ691_58230 [Kutzneria sp. CA-103260]
MTGPYPQPGSWGPPPPRKSQTGAVIGTIVGVVLMLGIGTWAVVGIISSRHSTDAGGSTTSPTRTTSRAPRTSSVNSVQYHVNDCVWLDVDTSERVACTSDKAALQINLVIPQKSKCPGDFGKYGDNWYSDESAIRYCASLTVPKGQCVKMDLEGSGLVERVACGANPQTYQVTDVVSGTDGSTACAKVPNTDDVWFYQSNLSGQFACLKQLGG